MCAEKPQATLHFFNMTINISLVPESDSRLLQLHAPLQHIGCAIVLKNQKPTEQCDFYISLSTDVISFPKEASETPSTGDVLLIGSSYESASHSYPMPKSHLDLAKILLIGLHPKIDSEISFVPAFLDEFFDGDTEGLQSFVKSMLEANTADLSALAACAEQSLWDDLASVAHRLKGATSLVHCMTIGDICSLLHSNAKKKNAAESRALCWLVEQAILPLQKALSDSVKPA